MITKLTIKQIVNILILLISLYFIFSYLTMIKKNEQLKSDNIRIEKNLSELNTINSKLVLTSNELKKYLKNKDTQHKKEIDSILTNHNIKVKELSKLQIVEIIVKDTVPFYIQFNDTNKLNDTLYQKDFLIEKNCIRMNGRVFSTDINSKIEIINIENKNRIFITQSYKKNFLDYILFRKGKLVEKITSDCGNTNNSEINVE